MIIILGNAREPARDHGFDGQQDGTRGQQDTTTRIDAVRRPQE